MHRLERARVLTLGVRMQRSFRWLVPAAIAAIFVLGFLNVRAASGTGRNVLDAAFGLPRVTLQAAYAFDTGQ